MRGFSLEVEIGVGLRRRDWIGLIEARALREIGVRRTEAIMWNLGFDILYEVGSSKGGVVVGRRESYSQLRKAVNDLHVPQWKKSTTEIGHSLLRKSGYF